MAITIRIKNRRNEMLVSICYGQFMFDTNDVLFAEKRAKNELKVTFRDDSVKVFVFEDDCYYANTAINDIKKASCLEFDIKGGDTAKIASELAEARERQDQWCDIAGKWRRKYKEANRKAERCTAKRKPSEKQLRGEISRLELLIVKLHKNKGE